MSKSLRKTSSPAGNRPDQFHAAAHATLSELVAASVAVANTFRKSAKTAADFARLLGLPKKAAWQFFRVAECTDPLVAANFAPGHKPMRDLISAARRVGLGEAPARRLDRAFLAFESFVEQVAGDRNTFIAMLGRAARDPDANADLDRQHRIQLFKSFSHFFGMHVGCSADVRFIKEPVLGQRTEVSLRSVTGLCRLRADAHCIVERHRQFGTGNSSDDLLLQPLDMEAFKEHGAPVLPAFCSKPTPTLVVDYGQEPNLRVIEWAGSSVGAHESVDVTIGVINRSVYPAPNDDAEHGVRERTRIGYPVKRMTQTWFVDMASNVTLLPPRLNTFLDPDAGSLSALGSRGQSQRLYENTVEFFPAGSWNKLPDHFSGIRELVAHTCALMRWDPADFAICNLEIDYPLVSTVLLTEIPWKIR